jgi:chemotaxis protein MotB
MQFLYDEFPQNRKLFRKYLSASGRAFANPILKANGTEDKDASRRIEIKFQITNEDAAKELMNYINKRDKNE